MFALAHHPAAGYTSGQQDRYAAWAVRFRMPLTEAHRAMFDANAVLVDQLSAAHSPSAEFSVDESPSPTTSHLADYSGAAAAGADDHMVWDSYTISQAHPFRSRVSERLLGTIRRSITRTVCWRPGPSGFSRNKYTRT